MIYCCYQSFLDYKINLHQGEIGIYAKKLVLVNPSNIIINHVAVKFTVIWFPMNMFTQPALLYCMNETEGGSISEVTINDSVITWCA